MWVFVTSNGLDIKEIQATNQARVIREAGHQTKDLSLVLVPGCWRLWNKDLYWGAPWHSVSTTLVANWANAITSTEDLARLGESSDGSGTLVW